MQWLSDNKLEDESNTLPRTLHKITLEINVELGETQQEADLMLFNTVMRSSTKRTLKKQPVAKFSFCKPSKPRSGDYKPK